MNRMEGIFATHVQPTTDDADNWEGMKKGAGWKRGLKVVVLLAIVGLMSFTVFMMGALYGAKDVVDHPERYVQVK